MSFGKALSAMGQSLSGSKKKEEEKSPSDDRKEAASSALETEEKKKKDRFNLLKIGKALGAGMTGYGESINRGDS
tara:strand:+ start:382 stop:606 length:225 start_codon:yes stop_codon:yes gene_type:complete